MALDQLDNPIRATWDLQTADSAMSSADANIVLQRLVDAQLFFVTLEQSPLAHPDCGVILRELCARGIQVLLLTDGSDAELMRLGITEALPLTVLVRLQPFIDDDGVDFRRLTRVIQALRQAGISPGFSLTPQRDNIAHLRPLLAFAGEHEVRRFKLPNVRIDDNFQQVGQAQVLRPVDLEILRQDLPDLHPLIRNLDLEIHDLFLWELLTPDSDKSRSEYGGCQAANSLAHIRTDGTVWPCLSWPRPIGSLLQSSFAEIWSAPATREIRRMIAVTPSGCHDCADYRLCFGGCRGLSDVLATDGGLDPMCRGPR